MSRREDPADGQGDRSPSRPLGTAVALAAMAVGGLFLVGGVLLVLRYGVAVPLKQHAEQASMAGQRLGDSVGAADEPDEDLDPRPSETEITILPLPQVDDAGEPTPFPAAEDFAKLLDPPDAGAATSLAAGDPPSPEAVSNPEPTERAALKANAAQAQPQEVDEPRTAKNGAEIEEVVTRIPSEPALREAALQNEAAPVANLGAPTGDPSFEAESARELRGPDTERAAGPDYWVVPVAAAYGQPDREALAVTKQALPRAWRCSTDAAPGAPSSRPRHGRRALPAPALRRRPRLGSPSRLRPV
jgi:hypothetical protein